MRKRFGMEYVVIDVDKMKYDDKIDLSSILILS